jgi:hypothetical protein
MWCLHPIVWGGHMIIVAVCVEGAESESGWQRTFADEERSSFLSRSASSYFCLTWLSSVFRREISSFAWSSSPCSSRSRCTLTFAATLPAAIGTSTADPLPFLGREDPLDPVLLVADPVAFVEEAFAEAGFDDDEAAAGAAVLLAVLRAGAAVPFDGAAALAAGAAADEAVAFAGAAAAFAGAEAARAPAGPFFFGAPGVSPLRTVTCSGFANTPWSGSHEK